MNTSFVRMSSDVFLQRNYVVFWALLGFFILFVSMLQGCSSNGFHLRKSVELPSQYQTILLENTSIASDFRDVFEEVLEDAGGSLVVEGSRASVARSIIRLKDFKQGKRVVAYTSERKVREYLLYLKFNYEIVVTDGDITKDGKARKLPVRRINIDKSYLYDPDYALGKAEEEKLVKEGLYREASRLILLHLQYSK